MAVGQVEVGRRESILARLLTPRPITLTLAVGAGAALGHVAWSFVPYQLTVYLSSILAPVCMAVAVAAWAMRDKADSSFDADYLAAGEYVRSREVMRDIRGKSLGLAAVCVICAALVAGPTISAQVLKFYWHWVVVAAGIGLGLTAYCFQVAFTWEEQLRAYREKLIATAKQTQAHEELLARLSSDVPSKPGQWGTGWTTPSKDKWSPPH